MSNISCTCIIPFCKFYKVKEYAEPRFLVGHLVRHDEEELKEVAINLGVISTHSTLSKEAIARRLLSFCRWIQ